MKTLLLALFLFSCLAATAQQNQYKVSIKQKRGSITSIELPFVETPTHYDSTDNSVQVGIGIKTDIDFIKTATLIKKDHKKYFYGIKVNSPNALALLFVFNKFKLPPNSVFTICSANQDTVYDKDEGEYILTAQRRQSGLCEAKNVLLLLEISKKEIKNCEINIETISHIFRKIILTP